MLAKENRLREKKDFERILKKGRVFRGRFLILRIIENKLGKTRFGFIVSQKISKKAVVRNKVKRRLREIMKTKIKNLKKELDIVFITLSGIELKTFSEIKEEIEEILERAKILD